MAETSVRSQLLLRFFFFNRFIFNSSSESSETKHEKVSRLLPGGQRDQLICTCPVEILKFETQFHLNETQIKSVVLSLPAVPQAGIGRQMSSYKSFIKMFI